MTRLALMTALATLFAAPVMAGGYVAPAVEAPVEVVPVLDAPVATSLNWGGAYAGLRVGRACCGDDEVGVGVGNNQTLSSPDTLELGGTTYGLRAGYRWQSNVTGLPGVFGLELGYDTGSVSDEFTTGGYTASNEVQNVLALRAKAGVLNGAKDTLFYGSAGVARGEFDYVVNGTGAGGPIDIDTTFKSSGYVVGLGVERKLTERLSLTGEWEYANFGKTALEDAANKTTNATPDFHSLRLGVNFNF